jgi:hypothetical protein
LHQAPGQRQLEGMYFVLIVPAAQVQLTWPLEIVPVKVSVPPLIAGSAAEAVTVSAPAPP